MTQSIDPKSDDKSEPLAARLKDADVAAYLEARPDFFVHNEDLVAILDLPSRAKDEGVTDFHAYVLTATRQKLDVMNGMQDDLTGIIRDNIRAQETIHSAVLEALRTDTQEEFLHCILQRWTDILDIEAIALGLLTPPIERLTSGNLNALTAEQIEARFAQDKADEGGKIDHLFLNLDEEEPLFGPAAPLVKSCVLLRMKQGSDSIGILALGWREKDGFGPGRGTETLRFLTDSLSAMLAPWSR